MRILCLNFNIVGLETLIITIKQSCENLKSSKNYIFEEDKDPGMP